MNDQETSDLLARVRDIKNIELPALIHQSVARYSASFTPDCLEPYELLEWLDIDDMPEARQQHVQECFRCAFMIGDTSAIATNAAKRPGAEVAAAVATTYRAVVIGAQAAPAEVAPPERPRRQLIGRIAAGILSVVVAGFFAVPKLKARLFASRANSPAVHPGG